MKQIIFIYFLLKAASPVCARDRDESLTLSIALSSHIYNKWACTSHTQSLEPSVLSLRQFLLGCFDRCERVLSVLHQENPHPPSFMPPLCAALFPLDNIFFFP